jgi:hypothetical protein
VLSFREGRRLNSRHDGDIDLLLRQTRDGAAGDPLR